MLIVLMHPSLYSHTDHFYAHPQIILLNMLIVMMFDTYREVREKQQDTFLRGRAEHVVETETLMTQKERERWSLMPPYLHLLVRVSMHCLHILKELYFLKFCQSIMWRGALWRAR